MRVLERHTQTLEKGGWETYVAKEKMHEAREKRQGGFPTKRHFRPVSNLGGTAEVWSASGRALRQWKPPTRSLLAIPRSRRWMRYRRLSSMTVLSCLSSIPTCRRNGRCRWTLEVTGLGSRGLAASQVEA